MNVWTYVVIVYVALIFIFVCWHTISELGNAPLWKKVGVVTCVAMALVIGAVVGLAIVAFLVNYDLPVY